MTTPERSQSSGFSVTHEPVLVAEVVDWLVPRPDGLYVDCTVGLGGHTRALVAAGAGHVIGLDRDTGALDMAQSRLEAVADRVTLVHADYRDITAVLAARPSAPVAGIVADLGVSSMQLDDATRGFSFRLEGPLDMRMDRTGGATLADRLGTIDEADLADVIFQYGEERRSRRVARAILQAYRAGRLTDTQALARVVRGAVASGSRQRLDPATRTFQALRIWVNGELDRLDSFLGSAANALQSGGRLCVIAFHSLEDRIVKHTFRQMAADADTVRVLTRRPVRPAEPELARNPRARSARLRVLEKLS